MEIVVVVEREDDLGRHPRLSQKGTAEMTGADQLADPDHHRRHYREAEERRLKTGEAAIDPGHLRRSFLRNRIVTTEDLLVDRREVEVSRVIVHRADLLVGLLAADHHLEEEKRKSVVRPADLLLGLQADHHPEEGIRKRIDRVVDLTLVL